MALTPFSSFLPEGTSAFVHFYSLHRDPRYFSHPDTFWPERWLSEEDRKAYGCFSPTGPTAPDIPLFEKSNPKSFLPFIHIPAAFIPFSYGPMGCVGKKLAMQEMRTLVCCLMQRLELRFADGYDAGRWGRDLKDFFVSVRGELPVVVVPRARGGVCGQGDIGGGIADIGPGSGTHDGAS